VSQVVLQIIFTRRKIANFKRRFKICRKRSRNIVK